MTKVAFVCTHNSCRSQIAEALGRHLAADVFESFSAGTHPKDAINSDALRLMKALYNIDMAQSQHPKLLEELPPVDIVVTMGCGVECPWLPVATKAFCSQAMPAPKNQVAATRSPPFICHRQRSARSPSKMRVDWGLPDPTGLPDDEFIAVIRDIGKKILRLKIDLFDK
ncbi:MAG TPA: arsenate reductase ArsC [Terriglobales bacterium]|nr:arsenate reductase ArsC [Terriglobales bacterium]